MATVILCAICNIPVGYHQGLSCRAASEMLIDKTIRAVTNQRDETFEEKVKRFTAWMDDKDAPVLTAIEATTALVVVRDLLNEMVAYVRKLPA